MRKVVLKSIAGSLLGIIFSTQLSAMNGWETISPVAAGFAWNPGERLDNAVENRELRGLHSVIVVHNHRLVVERYYEGYDKIWGDSIGNIEFTPNTLHDLQSITKSIISLLYGIALAEGKVPPIETPLVDQFPAYEDLMTDPDRRRITVKHALTMTMGLEWNEDFPYGDMRNNETAMWRARDRYRYALSQPIVANPGTRFTYSGGATTLLGRIITTGVGKSLPDYAREKLFNPLSITDFDWTKVGEEEDAAGGLRLRPRDLAKIGQLVLNQGRWNGNQLVPSEWLLSSFVESAVVDEKERYGYQWWLGQLQESNHRWIAGIGWGNQGLIIIPVHQLVIVINAGNYGVRGTKLIPTIVRNYILPALRD